MTFSRGILHGGVLALLLAGSSAGFAAERPSSNTGVWRSPPSVRTASGAAGYGCESWLAPADRHRPEPPLPPREIAHGLRQIPLREGGPHAFGEDQLGVGALPEQEVREPLLAAGADQEVDVRHGKAVVG